jgi:hypothetical protein
VPISKQPSSHALFVEHLVSATLLGTDTGAECSWTDGGAEENFIVCLVPLKEKAGKENVSTFKPVNVSFSN